jgi:hypothetical protein
MILISSISMLWSTLDDKQANDFSLTLNKRMILASMLTAFASIDLYVLIKIEFREYFDE